MNAITSDILQGYYTRIRETLSTEPVLREELSRLGVASIRAEYDGVGDSGQIEELTFLDNLDPPQPLKVNDETEEKVKALLYALIESRHSGWENNDGAFGNFCWDLVDGAITHKHSERFLDHETSFYEGFEQDDGAMP